MKVPLPFTKVRSTANAKDLLRSTVDVFADVSSRAPSGTSITVVPASGFSGGRSGVSSECSPQASPCSPQASQCSPQASPEPSRRRGFSGTSLTDTLTRALIRSRIAVGFAPGCAGGRSGTSFTDVPSAQDRPQGPGKGRSSCVLPVGCRKPEGGARPRRPQIHGLQARGVQQWRRVGVVLHPVARLGQREEAPLAGCGAVFRVV